jgi:hypothetical protein
VFDVKNSLGVSGEKRVRLFVSSDRYREQWKSFLVSLYKKIEAKSLVPAASLQERTQSLKN